MIQQPIVEVPKNTARNQNLAIIALALHFANVVLSASAHRHPLHWATGLHIAAVKFCMPQDAFR